MERIIAVDLNIGNAKEYFDQLKLEYEKEASDFISPDLVWNRLDDKKVSLVTFSRKCDFLDEKNRDVQYEWCLRRASVDPP